MNKFECDIYFIYSLNHELISSTNSPSFFDGKRCYENSFEIITNKWL